MTANDTARDPGIRQRLVAILAADAAGYSRRMSEDEHATLDALETARSVFRTAIEHNNGRVIDTAGDSVLAVFDTARGALAAAIAVQSDLSAREGGSLHFRIGIHLGDIIQKPDGTVYGDGVNVAARLQALADPGSVLVSDLVYGALRGKMGASFAEHGTHRVKNIDRPITAFRVCALGEVAERPASEVPTSERASVAVLPFDNMSGDERETYIADGLTEDLITALSRYRGLRVIARNTCFAYRGRAVDVRQAAKELGAQYVLEGSIRKSGTRLRVVAQLIDGASGDHLWAERYDRELQDLFAVQDDIVSMIAGRLEPEVATVELQRAMRKPTQNLSAWDCYYLALSQLYRFTSDGNAEAERLFRRAIEFDGNFALAHARLAYCMILDMVYYDAPATAEVLDEILSLTKKAVSLDSSDAYCHLALGRAHIARREYELGLAACEAGLRLNPSMGIAYCGMGDALAYAGRAQDAVECFETAIRLSPNDPWRWAFYTYGALTLIFLRRFEDATEWAQQALLVPNCQYWASAHLAVALGHLGKQAEASAALASLKRKNPEFSLSYAREQLFYLERTEQIELYMDGLRRAGMTA